MEGIQKFLTILEFKYLIGALISKFLSCIGIDMAHHKIDLFLRILTDIFALWNNSPDHFMVVFATAFLIGSAGIAIKHLCAGISLHIELNSRRIGKFAPVIC